MEEDMTDTGSRAIRAMEDAYQLATFAKMPVVLVRGKGCEVYDADGTRYLDLYAGHCVALLGHCPEGVVAALRDQAGKLLFYSNAVYNDARAVACRKLVQFAGDPFTKVFLVNSGTEANEAALRLAFMITGRGAAVAVLGDFHGRTAASNALTGGPDSPRPFPRTPFETRFLPMNEVGGIAEIVREDTAAVLLEPVQSIAGVVAAEPAFARALASRCREVGAMLVSDEVQCGFGRLGDRFGWTRIGFRPDMMTCAKGLGGGFPVGALFVTEEIAARVRHGDLGCTFGGGPMACAAVGATIDAIVTGDLAARARRLGSLIRRRCTVGPVRAIRGFGLLLGLECHVDAAEVQRYLLERRILVGTSRHPRVVRLMPPLVLRDEHVEELAGALAEWKESADREGIR